MPGSAAAPGYAPGVVYAQGWVPPKAKVEPLAVASVPAGIVLGPVGVGLGAVSLRRMPKKRTRGKGWAVAGMVLGTVVTLAWGLGAWGVLANQAAREPLATDVTKPVTAYATQLVLGNCISQLPENGDVREVSVVPCDQRHHAQVIARTDFAADEVWPGDKAVADQTRRICGADELGTNPPDGITRYMWVPTAESWGKGDRVGLCIAASDEPLTADLAH